MIPGLVIFLSLLVLGLIWLYALTKDRWKWRRIVSRLGLCILTVSCLAALAAYRDTIWRLFHLATQRQNEYAGLWLGMTIDEVIHEKGAPTSVFSEWEPGKTKWSTFIETFSDIKIGRDTGWDYEDGIELMFDKQNNSLVEIACQSFEKFHRCPAMYGVWDGDSEGSLIETVGQPSTSEIKNGIKIIRYKSGAHFYLKKGVVYRLSLHQLKPEKATNHGH